MGGIGSPPSLIQAILEKGVTNLNLIGNDTGFPDVGIGRLVTNERVKSLITSHIGSNPNAGRQLNEGRLQIEFSPQGTLAERIRAGGVGLGGVLVDVGVDTIVEEGKRTVEMNGKTYLVETALTAEVAIVYAKKADPFGNLVFDKSARNMNPHVAMAGGYNDCRSRRNRSTGKFRSRRNCCPRSICKLYRTVGRSELEMGMGVEVRDKIARRAAKEIQNGMIVNLGIGIPSLVPNHLPDDINVMFHAENGIVGMGPTPSKGNEDENLCNAAGLPTSLITGASYFDSCTAFGMIRKRFTRYNDSWFITSKREW